MEAIVTVRHPSYAPNLIHPVVEYHVAPIQCRITMTVNHEIEITD